MEIADFIENLKGRKNLSEDEVKNVLLDYGIPTTKFYIIRSDQEFSNDSIDYPVVMKVCSPEILHKTEVGGVVLNIRDNKEAKSVFSNLRIQFPNEKILIENMEKEGLELIMGIIRDNSFGLSIMVGLGGIFAEALKDISFRVIPITKYDAEVMLDDLKAAIVLDGFRGMKVNKNLAVDILLKLSNLGQDFEEHLNQMDLNPIILRENNVVVVDAKMMLK